MTRTYTARRTLIWSTILGLVIGLAIIQQRRDDAPPIEPVGDAHQTPHDGGTAQVVPNGTRFPVSTTASDQAVGTCEQIVNDAAEFAEMERNAANPIQAPEPSNNWLRAQVERLQRSSAGSPDLEPFLTVLLLNRPERQVSDDPSAQAMLLELGTRAANSDSTLLAWHALRACVEAEEYCPFAHLEQSVLEADRDNAEAWALVSTLRYQRGDVAGALTAMQDAAGASTSTWYWSETVALIEHTLAEQTAIAFADRVRIAFGAMASALPSQSSLLNMCNVQSAASRAWGEACLAFGTMRGENETMMARSTAYTMRHQVLTALGDTERAEEVAAERALFRAKDSAGGVELTRSRARVHDALIRSSPERLDAYLSAIQQFGESDGVRMFLWQELPPLLERAGLLERDGMRECVAQFLEPPEAVETRSATIQNYRIQEYPVQVGDRLQISVPGQGALSRSILVGPDGMITLLRGTDIAAVGKTTGQIQREIATILSEQVPSTEVFVFLLAPRSSEELQSQFDDASSEAAQRREE